MSDFNEKVMAEFRANGGVVGGFFEGRDLLILHTIGAKSGLKRETPLVCSTDGDRYVIVASAGGADNHPAWYHNLVKNPDVTIEVGTEKFDAIATIAEEPERTRLYEHMETVGEFFSEYKQKAQRVIPVITIARK